MCAFVVNVPLKIEASRELEARLKESERTGPSTPTISPPSRHSLPSVCFFPVFRRAFARIVRRKRISVSSASPRRRHGAAEPVVAECPFIFIFVAFPRGAVSPYIYLIAPPDPQSRSTIPPSAAVVLSPHLHTSRPRVLCASIIRAVSHPALACPRNN